MDDEACISLQRKGTRKHRRRRQQQRSVRNMRFARHYAPEALLQLSQDAQDALDYRHVPRNVLAQVFPPELAKGTLFPPPEWFLAKGRRLRAWRKCPATLQRSVVYQHPVEATNSEEVNEEKGSNKEKEEPRDVRNDYHKCNDGASNYKALDEPNDSTKDGPSDSQLPQDNDRLLQERQAARERLLRLVGGSKRKRQALPEGFLQREAASGWQAHQGFTLEDLQWLRKQDEAYFGHLDLSQLPVADFMQLFGKQQQSQQLQEENRIDVIGRSSWNHYYPAADDAAESLWTTWPALVPPVVFRNRAATVAGWSKLAGKTQKDLCQDDDEKDGAFTICFDATGQLGLGLSWYHEKGETAKKPFCRVEDIVASSASAVLTKKCGLQVGDCLLEIQGIPITSLEQALELLQELQDVVPRCLTFCRGAPPTTPNTPPLHSTQTTSSVEQENESAKRPSNSFDTKEKDDPFHPCKKRKVLQEATPCLDGGPFPMLQPPLALSSESATCSDSPSSYPEEDSCRQTAENMDDVTRSSDAASSSSRVETNCTPNMAPHDTVLAAAVAAKDMDEDDSSPLESSAVETTQPATSLGVAPADDAVPEHMDGLTGALQPSESSVFETNSQDEATKSATSLDVVSCMKNGAVSAAGNVEIEGSFILQSSESSAVTTMAQDEKAKPATSLDDENGAMPAAGNTENEGSFILQSSESSAVTTMAQDKTTKPAASCDMVPWMENGATGNMANDVSSSLPSESSAIATKGQDEPTTPSTNGASKTIGTVPDSGFLSNEGATPLQTVSNALSTEREDAETEPASKASPVNAIVQTESNVFTTELPDESTTPASNVAAELHGTVPDPGYLSDDRSTCLQTESSALATESVDENTEPATSVAPVNPIVQTESNVFTTKAHAAFSHTTSLLSGQKTVRVEDTDSTTTPFAMDSTVVAYHFTPRTAESTHVAPPTYLQSMRDAKFSSTSPMAPTNPMATVQVEPDSQKLRLADRRRASSPAFHRLQGLAEVASQTTTTPAPLSCLPVVTVTRAEGRPSPTSMRISPCDRAMINRVSIETLDGSVCSNAKESVQASHVVGKIELQASSALLMNEERKSHPLDIDRAKDQSVLDRTVLDPVSVAGNAKEGCHEWDSSQDSPVACTTPKFGDSVTSTSHEECPDEDIYDVEDMYNVEHVCCKQEVLLYQETNDMTLSGSITMRETKVWVARIAMGVILLGAMVATCLMLFAARKEEPEQWPPFLSEHVTCLKVSATPWPTREPVFDTCPVFDEKAYICD